MKILSSFLWTHLFTQITATWNILDKCYSSFAPPCNILGYLQKSFLFPSRQHTVVPGQKTQLDLPPSCLWPGKMPAEAPQKLQVRMGRSADLWTC